MNREKIEEAIFGLVDASVAKKAQKLVTPEQKKEEKESMEDHASSIKAEVLAEEELRLGVRNLQPTPLEKVRVPYKSY